METFSDVPSVKTIWTAVSGQVHAPPLFGSILIYSLAFITCLLLQHLCRRLLPRRVYSYVADFCFTFLVCCYPYGHGAVRATYGPGGYVIAAVTMVTLSFSIFEGVPSPLGVFERYLKGEESLQGLGLRVVLQVTGAFMSYRLVFLICCLEVTKEHQMMLQDTCVSDLNVPVLVGCLIEFFSVTYDTWLCHQRLFRRPFLDDVTKNINGALLVCAGVHLTGMYMHPAMATAMTFNCKGTNAMEHLAVYWIASFLGCFVGIKFSSIIWLPTAANVIAVQKKSDVDNTTYDQGKSSQMMPLTNGHVKEATKDGRFVGHEKTSHNNNGKPARRRRKR